MNIYIYRLSVVLIAGVFISLLALPVLAEDSMPKGGEVMPVLSDEAFSEAEADASEEHAVAKIAVAPWRLNAPPELAYLKAALTDMLSSRMSADDSVEVTQRDVVYDAYGFYSNGLTGSTAAAFGIGLNVDYVLYGSLSVLGGELSLDASLVDVRGGAVETFFFKGHGVESVIALTEALAEKVFDKLKGLNDAEPLAAVSVVDERTLSEGPSYTGKFSMADDSSSIIEPTEVPVEIVVPVVAPGHKTDVDRSDGFITKADIKSGKLEAKSSWRFKLGSGLFNDMEVVDLDGDGRLEIFAMKVAEIHIFRVMEDGTLKRLTVIDGIGDSKNISISTFDSDADGFDELYISRIKAGRADSCILEANSDGSNDGFEVKSCGIPFIIKSVVIDGHAMLLGQEFNKNWGLKRAVYELTVTSEGVIKGDKVPLPKGSELYGVAYGDVFGDGTDQLISIDNKRRLRVYERESADKWSREWRSTEKFGGTLTTLEYGDSQGTAKETFSLEGDIYTVDTDDNGGVEVILKTNLAGGVFGKYSKRVREFKGGFISALKWDGSGLVELWRTKEITGYVADFFIGDLDGDGARDITILVTEGTGFSSHKSKSYILFHRLSI
ncbi:MAG: VCBS repeat-containing protein [Deltaproteobacteria bacterium]|nr:VCBS repeat-containing protein [Deltaproteobacteria bacterium]